MKKVIAAFALLALFVSCSTDSETVTAPQLAQPVKLAKNVFFQNFTFNLSYNEAHQLTSAVSEDGDMAYTLQYQNGNISNVSGHKGEETFDVGFTYTSEGIISGMTTQGQPLYVDYNPELRIYKVSSEPNSLGGTEFTVNPDGDLREVRGLYSNGYTISARTFSYEENQKGPLYNANRVTLHLAMACSDNVIYSSIFGAYKPFKRYSASQTTINLQSELDDQGFVSVSKKYTSDYATFIYNID